VVEMCSTIGDMTVRLTLESFLGDNLPKDEPNRDYPSIDTALMAAWDISAGIRQAVMVRKSDHYGSIILAQVKAYP
jgi:hypothetical protein